jgi:uncharacterized lipoprotein YddW (UPF0748 family)
MQSKAFVLVLLLCVFAATNCVAQDTAILKVKGRGVEGRPVYQAGGAVRFGSVSVDAQVVHFGSDSKAALPLVIEYDVIEPAPILLTSRLGSEHWQLYDFANEGMATMYADQRIDLSEPGKHVARSTRAWFGNKYGPLPKPGLVAIRGHHYFLIDQADGKWLDVTSPPAYFNQADVLRDLAFTLADLSEYELAVSEIESIWKAGGPLRVRVVVRDGQGRTLPVVGAPVVATTGKWRTELATEWTPLDEPTGWMRGTLPGVVPKELSISGQVALQTPDGLKTETVTARFPRGVGLVEPEQFKIAEQGYELARDRDGTIRETRAVWVSNSDIASTDKIDRLVARCSDARLNVIVPNIFVRNDFYAKSDLIPITGRVEDGFDPLAGLIAKAHAAGLEVHPWFCVTYRDRHFREWFSDKHGCDVDMMDPEGKAIPLGADVHRPEYRRFIVDLMVGVARDYDVDGIHHDYIRTMGRCFCAACRAEYVAAHGGKLDDATDEQWMAWQREAIGDIVERTAEGVREVRPDAILSAAVFSSMPSGASQGQDPDGWADRGWLDVVIPMDYQMQTLKVRSNERQFLAAMSNDDQLVTGLSLYMRSGDRVLSRSSELVLDQIELVRRMGIHGYCLFAFGHMSDEQLEVLRNEANPEPARPFFRK